MYWLDMSKKPIDATELVDRISRAAEADPRFISIDLAREIRNSLEHLQRLLEQPGPHDVPALLSQIAADARRAEVIMWSRSYKVMMQVSTTLSERIVHVLDYHPHMVFSSEDVLSKLADAGVQADDHSIKRLLVRLASTGRVQRLARGRYAANKADLSAMAQ